MSIRRCRCFGLLYVNSYNEFGRHRSKQADGNYRNTANAISLYYQDNCGEMIPLKRWLRQRNGGPVSCRVTTLHVGNH